MSKGGFKAFRGSSAAASAYLLETGAARLDEYYSEGGERAIQYGIIGDAGVELSTLNSVEFTAWMEHRDPETGEQRGTFRQRTYVDKNGETKLGGTPLFQETLVSSSKSLSLAAAADPRIADALDAAQARAALAGVEALQEHAVTRIGPKGAQYQAKLERMEFTSVQHRTSRADDPHWHRHVQITPKAFAEGKWRSIDGATLYRLSGRMHAAADLSMSADVPLREAIAEAGYTWIPGEGGGKIVEFEHLVDDFSSRRDQVAENREALETRWRAEHVGKEPGPKQLRAWDQLGWSHQRPAKSVKGDVTSLDADGLAQGLEDVVGQNTDHFVAGQSADQISPTVIAMTALDDLSQSHSAWSAAELNAAIDRRIAQTYLLGTDGVPELRTAAFNAAQVEQYSFFDDGVVIEGNRHYTSKAVMATEQDLTDRLTARAQQRGSDGTVFADRGGFTLSDEQVKAAQTITGNHALVVIEGAAGAGKTTMLDAANEQLKIDGRRMVVVSPTKRGALEAGSAIGAEGNSVHSMLYRAGASMHPDTGKWVIPQQWKEQPAEFTIDGDTVLVVDECGMLDQDTARVLHKYVDEAKLGTLVLTGDTKQLAAVGRGGYMARAAELTTVYSDLQDVRRFRTADGQIDTQYADASVVLREREGVDDFYNLLDQRGQVQLGTSEEVIDRVSETVALELIADEESLAIVSTNATAQRVNHAVFERLVAAGVVDDSRVVYGLDEDPIAVGARVATRQNDRDLDVANRQTFTVDRVNQDGRITVKDENGRHRELTAEYVAENVQLAYAVTAHGAQGMTVDTAHTILSDQMDAAGAYVALTRGRHANVLHAVAIDQDDAREQFSQAMARESADTGLEGALKASLQELDGLDVPTQPLAPTQAPVARDRQASGLSDEQMRQAELIAVVRDEHSDGSVDVDFQLASYGQAAQGQKSLRLQEAKTGQRLSAEQYNQLCAASSGRDLEVDPDPLEDFGKRLLSTGGNDVMVEGKHVIAVKGDIQQQQDGNYTVDVVSLQESTAHQLIQKDVLSVQRQSEDKAHKQPAPAQTTQATTDTTETTDAAPAKPLNPAMAKMQAMRQRQNKQNTRLRKEREMDQSQVQSL
ncbi:nucleoside-triphosphatase THEP1 [Leucobacter exalbidus]|uniref:Nucleoside-triphosphatase THEP1 n=1 Tax=Leucobacter exalbidus TaxID=662960 RepID=A0A940PTS2_9MICO|nr:MobF family relaxase [Leucobacter exalbidus]MBP1325071.1 nucleoside-triphosphatase THEP1 [Leucobacter exalbidus]